MADNTAESPVVDTTVSTAKPSLRKTVRAANYAAEGVFSAIGSSAAEGVVSLTNFFETLNNRSHALVEESRVARVLRTREIHLEGALELAELEARKDKFYSDNSKIKKGTANDPFQILQDEIDGLR